MKYILFCLLLFSGSLSFAFEDPTKGKDFLPWLWEDQFKPTIQASADSAGLGILAAGGVGAAAFNRYDRDIYEHNRRGHNLMMNEDMANALANVGNGVMGISIALTQIVFDQQNGLMHARAIALTSISHVSLAYGFQRKRPGGRQDYLSFDSSFPSGHASSAFATAASLGYAYGWKVGVPAYLVATSIAAARVTENAHWASDVVAGAALGIFWARASYLANENHTSASQWMPVPLPGGLMISWQRGF